MVTVGELIKLLKSYPRDTTVWVSSDGEGNLYKPLYQIGLMDTFDEEEYDDEIEKVYSEAFEDLDLEEVVMLWPVG